MTLEAEPGREDAIVVIESRLSDTLPSPSMATQDDLTTCTASPASTDSTAPLAQPSDAEAPAKVGRALALLAGEIAANAAIWIVAGIVFGRNEEKRGVLSLCVVAWTLGLRHALDMDHICAIDNVTRSLVAAGQTPVTVGLFFSLGHSTIVIAMTIAIIIATSAIDKVPDVSSIGGVIGVSVSASFLFLLAVINSVFLWQSLRQAKQRKRARHAAALAAENPRAGPTGGDLDLTLSSKKLDDEEASLADSIEADKARKHAAKQEDRGGMPMMSCIGRIGRPMFRLINRPWKMYPIGVLFGIGFDTASEISLLGISALASGKHHIPSSQIIILPLLFTAGMTAIDSLDSIFMLSAYTMPQRVVESEYATGVEVSSSVKWMTWIRSIRFVEKRPTVEEREEELRVAAERAKMLPHTDQDKLVNISVVLTIISIAVALIISITEFMGLALEKCSSCSDAADNDSGLSGRWWRFWRAFNDNSGYIGGGVVGLFIAVFAGWGIAHFWNRRKERRTGKQARMME
ncbi:hypothetical protein JCM10908_004926 [Rhodotorula pacifica]|uniref:HoxN/HupN/NixA family nickel/cobalt transporter n=1 Tax=Rhodotorula pacifica TaxID=1495444 RepID=UPI00317CA6D6